MKPSFTMTTDYVQVPRQVTTPVTIMEAVTVNKPDIVYEDTIVQKPKVTTAQKVVQKQVVVRVSGS